MKIFISDEDKKFINNIEINYNDEHNSIGLIFNNELKSLEQHDAEVRKKVIEELYNSANKLMFFTDDMQGTYTGNGYKMCQDEIKRKLADLERTPQGKGEKDE